MSRNRVKRLYSDYDFKMTKIAWKKKFLHNFFFAPNQLCVTGIQSLTFPLQ